MYEILIIAFLLIALAIIVLVLIQKGKGADMGASFGAGASATLFGSVGTGNFLTRTTTILGVLFFIVSLALANIGSKKATNDSFWNLEDGSAPSAVVDQPTSVNQVETPAASQGSTIGQDQINSTSDIPE